MRADRAFGAFVALATIALASGCVTPSRSIDGVSAHIDDSAITSTVKSRMVEDKAVDANAIAVETSNGNVVLSGIAKSTVEKSTAESIAIKVPGVKSIQNSIVVKP